MVSSQDQTYRPVKLKGKGFPETSWSDIRRWPDATDEERNMSLSRFFYGYQAPLINFIISLGHSPLEADDIFQEFVTHHIKGKLFTSADPEKGKFRNLLLASLKRFIIDQRRKSQAQKRKPPKGIVHFESEFTEGIKWGDIISTHQTPEQIYEKSWLLALLDNATQRLKSEFYTKGQVIHFKVFKHRVIDPIFSGGNKPGLQSLAKKYGIKKSVASNYLVTSKRAYQRHLRAEIRRYVNSEKEITTEINDLLSYLQSFKD